MIHGIMRRDHRFEEGCPVSVLNEVRALEERVVARLNELRPLVEEYEELQRVAQRYGFDAKAAPAPAPSKPRRRAPAKRSRAASTSRRRGGGTRAVGAE